MVMPLRVVVVIREDPLKTHRAVEGLRIALGLSAGESPVTVVLLNEAPALLESDRDDIVDGEILEKHLPVLKELQVPFVMLAGASAGFSVDPQFTIREESSESIGTLIRSADRVLVF